jgi:DNA ligase-1
MKIVGTDDVRSWFAGSGSLSEPLRAVGTGAVDADYLDTVLGIPPHLRVVVQRLTPPGGDLPAPALDSIPFYSLCRGLFLPLSGMTPERAGVIFGTAVEPPPDAAGREKLVRDFLAKPIGLTALQKVGCVLGDPFQGRRSLFRRESLLALLMSVSLVKRRDLLDRLTRVGDVAVVFAESRANRRESPPLTAAEVLEALRCAPGERRTVRMQMLRSILTRCGKLEAYFLAKLLLRKAGLGFDYQGPLLAKMIASHYKTDEAAVAHAAVLTDFFRVVRVLETEGADGLRKIQLQPLVPVRPALAGGTTEEIDRYPVWVERKYDGIRLMLHKSGDDRGGVLCGAYTRGRQDWLELVAGLDAVIRMLPARSAIVDGELYGTVLDIERHRPASVYEVYGALQGEGPMPVNLKYAAFDLIYQDGADLTRLPLSQRRQRLAMLLAPLAGLPTPVPVTVSEGQAAANKDDVSRLYNHFRAQGYEGIITKDLDRPYALGDRDPSWRKRKPEITLDLVLLGAVLAVTEKTQAGMFGSYVIGARVGDGTFEDIGDVAGVDRVRDAEMAGRIMRDGLMTGRRIERPSASGVRPGFELRPEIVVTVKFEGITRDGPTGKLCLRDPKIASIRADKSASEADTTAAIQELYLRQRVG